MADEPDKPDTIKSDTPSAKSGKSLEDAGIKYLCSDISGSSCKDIVEWIIEENMKDKHPRLTLMISSYGGEVYASFALIDAMMGSKIPVDTVGLGYIASAALGIFIYGARRYLTNNTYILAHQYSGFRFGKQHELIAGRKEEDWLKERLIDMYTARSKLSREQVATLLLGPSDTFLTAKEALEYGLADEIRL
jgi:ATP-dependent Clp protease, protease subunit